MLLGLLYETPLLAYYTKWKKYYYTTNNNKPNFRGVKICFNNCTMCITMHGWRYDTKQYRLRVIRYDTILWQEIDITFFSVKYRVKENVYLCAVIEEVKHWKSLIRWTSQTFSSRPRFNLRGARTATENLSFSCCFLPWSTIIWRDAADTAHMSRTKENEPE